jgi:oligopeptide transport system ATP-binding protein
MQTSKTKEVLLSVKNIRAGSGRKAIDAARGVSFDVYKYETFGLAGEPGSGKTTIARAITRAIPLSDGEILYNGQRISGKISKQLDEEVERKIQIVFRGTVSSPDARRDLTDEERPELIITDEPIITRSVSEHGLTYIFLAHDLPSMRNTTDRIAIIRLGEIVELAPTEQMLTHPLHPYTKSLLHANPVPDPLDDIPRRMCEIEPEHFVLATDEEEEVYRRFLRIG